MKKHTTQWGSFVKTATLRPCSSTAQLVVLPGIDLPALKSASSHRPSPTQHKKAKTLKVPGTVIVVRRILFSILRYRRRGPHRKRSSCVPARRVPESSPPSGCNYTVQRQLLSFRRYEGNLGVLKQEKCDREGGRWRSNYVFTSSFAPSRLGYIVFVFLSPPSRG